MFDVGQQVIWIYETHHGSSRVVDLPGVVTQLGNKRVLIDITKPSGEVVSRWVVPEHLIAVPARGTGIKG